GRVEPHRDHLLSPYGISDDQLRVAATAHARGHVELERPRRDGSAVSVHPVDVEVYRGRHRYLAEVGRHHGCHAIGLHPEVGSDAKSTHPYRPTSGSSRGQGVPDPELQHGLRYCDGPVTVQPDTPCPPAIVGWVRTTTGCCHLGVTGYSVAHAEYPQLGDATERCPLDRKSTRLNSSHVNISYAVFCLK